MVGWTTVIVAVCLVFLIYFGYKGIRYAFSDKELPEPPEGDYEIKVVGRTRNGGFITVMIPHKAKDEEKAS